VAVLAVVLAAAMAVRYFSRRPAPVPPVPAATLEEAVANVVAEDTPQQETPPMAAGSTVPVVPAVVPEERPAPATAGVTAKAKPVGSEAATEPLPVLEPEPPPAADESKPPLAAARNSRGFLEAVLFNGTAMVQVPAGEFTIGSPPGQGDDDEHPAHRVFISAFWLGKSEVTFAQFDVFCADSGRPLPADEGWGRGSRPVIHVTWEDADAYCRWLSKKSGRRFRLPSEAEWEKAARERYPWGRKSPDRTLVNMKGRDDGYEFTAPVGAFPPGASSYGILDMAGNVWEWTSDWYDAGYYRASPGRDPRGPVGGESRSVRGGSWANGPELIRSANRSSERPGSRLNVLGFRVAMDD
jgi:formylglycine-generating enzyme required for sulfatase activity